MNPRPNEQLQPAIEHRVLAEVDGVSVIIETESAIEVEAAREYVAESPEPNEFVIESMPPLADFFAEELELVNIPPAEAMPPRPEPAAVTTPISQSENPAGLIETELWGLAA